MNAFIAESAVEEMCLDLFANLGWAVLHGPDIAPDLPGAERASYRDVLLEGRLRQAVERLNPELPAADWSLGSWPHSADRRASTCWRRTGASAGC